MPRRKTTRRRRLDKVMDYNPGNSFRSIDNKTIEDFNISAYDLSKTPFIRNQNGSKLHFFSYFLFQIIIARIKLTRRTLMKFLT